MFEITCEQVARSTAGAKAAVCLEPMRRSNTELKAYILHLIMKRAQRRGGINNSSLCLRAVRQFHDRLANI